MCDDPIEKKTGQVVGSSLYKVHDSLFTQKSLKNMKYA